MTLIKPTDQPIHWSVQVPNGDIPLSGVTGVGEATAAPHTVYQDSDPNAYLGKLPATKFPDLPDSGWLEQNAIYNYNGTLVMVRQSHNRQSDYSVDNITLYIRYRPGASGVLDWIAGEKVEVGTHRLYNAIEYVCLQAHVTQSDWQPPAVPALWSIYTPPPPPASAWSYPVAYKVNDLVTYNGSTYKCLQAHTSQAGWTPVAVPALWQKQP